MAKQTINIGIVTNDGTGDSLRVGAQKINDNFNELYNSLATGSFTIPVASSTQLGAVKVGSGLSISNSVLSLDYSLPVASPSVVGGIKVGSGLSITNGLLSVLLPTASNSVLGAVKVDGVTVTIDNTGTISAGNALPTNANGFLRNNGTGVLTWDISQSDWNNSDSNDPAFIKNKPTIPAAQIQSDWNQTDNNSKDYIKNKPEFLSGQEQSDWDQIDIQQPSYIKNKPALSVVATSNSYNDLYDLPTLFSGNYGDLNGAPTSIDEFADVDTSTTPPSTGQALVWDSSAWKPATLQALKSREETAGTTASIANGASANLTITGYKGYALYAIKTSVASWVTVYISSSARTADASRNSTTDPGLTSGVIAEVITSGTNQTIFFAPALYGYSGESPSTTDIQLKVVNLSGSTNAVTVTLTVLQLEA